MRTNKKVFLLPKIENESPNRKKNRRAVIATYVHCRTK